MVIAPIDDLLNTIARKVVLLVYPHPGEESLFSAGLIKRAILYDWRVLVVVLTYGELGRFYVNARGLNVGELRRREFGRAMDRLGVLESEIYDFGDGRLREGRGWKSSVADVVWAEEPSLIFTFDQAGMSANHDTIAVSREVFKLCKKKGETRLLWPHMMGLDQNRYLHPELAGFRGEPKWKLELTLGEKLDKWRALSCYSSQKYGRFSMEPLLWQQLTAGGEYFSEADYEQEYGYKYIPME